VLGVVLGVVMVGISLWMKNLGLGDRPPVGGRSMGVRLLQ
jgi:hypothetical protein